MRIHFIGIGGIGVSSLAQYYLYQGHQISGSDSVSSEITDFLAKKGVKILIGNRAENISPDFDMVIHSPAVKPDNPEYKKAREMQIKLQSYPQALGELTKKYYTIAVSGSHGKSTTTAMIGLALIKAGLDPTVIVGTKLKEFGNSNFKMGKSPDDEHRVPGVNHRANYLVIEACEYDGSFLEYSPKIAVITNIDKEHMDYFKTFANVVGAFKSFIMRLPKDGFLVFNKDDAGNSKLKIQNAKLQFKIQNYSVRQPEAKKLKKFLKVPGQHNVSNALAVLAVTRVLGVKDAITFKALSEFTGTWRRFEVRTTTLRGSTQINADTNADLRVKREVIIVSDYGHHPTEVVATLKAAREKFGKKKIWLIFQPHQHQRTFYLLKDFVALFKFAPVDQVIITDIYDVAGRETKNINAKIDSPTLVKKIGKKSVQYLSTDAAEKYVKKNIKSGEVLIIMGAGDVYKLADRF